MVKPELSYRALRERIKQVQDDETKDAKYLAAVLYGNLEPEQIADASDIFWVKCSAKTKVSKLVTHYLASSHFEEVPRPAKAQFMANGHMVQEHAQMQDLDMFGDHFIVFQVNDVAAMATGPLRVTSGNTANHLVPVDKISPGVNSDCRQNDASQPRPPKIETAPISPSLLRRLQEPTPSVKGEQGVLLNQVPTINEDSTQVKLPEQYTSFNSPRATKEVIDRAKQEARVQLYATPSATVSALLGGGNPKPAPTNVKPEPSPNQNQMVAMRSPSPERPENDFFVTNWQNDEFEQPAAFKGTFLQQIVNKDDLKLLESAAQAGIKILHAMEGHMVAQGGDADVAHWTEQISKLRQQLNRSRTVVGVVGNTGAGKSSVINALLDEERLVPTSCMRACTAVVTEISWNDSDDPAKKYRAEIEFISKADWEKELNALLRDLVDSNGEILREATTSSESDAGIAYSKMKAVYPQYTKEEFTNSTAEKLSNHLDVRRVLGTTKRLVDQDPSLFYKALQQYVDSKEKSEDGQEKEKKKKKGEKRQMEYWPLIKCVRIFTRSDALSTGAILVDLPGVQDSNAARAAVADGYMKQCSGLWVVAPITRAVNDKAAKKLLSDQFKRQMKFDGMFSNLTFICSKTDDISITEAAESLGIEEEIQESWDEYDNLEQQVRSLRKEIANYSETRGSYQEAMDDHDEQLEVWDDLETDLGKGKQVFAPQSKSKSKNKGSKKRKRKSAPKKSRKRVNIDFDADSEDDFVVSDESSSEDEEDFDNNPLEDENFGEPLTVDQIREKIDELKTARKEANKEKKEIGRKITGAKEKINELDQKMKDLKSEMSALCIAGRNEYSKGRIQEDFASGIKELDEETAIEEDEENFDPEVDLRDYEELARSLPVFCVSSRAYQKLSGRLRKDTFTPGFKSTEETGMPQLKDHCKKLTEIGRLNNCKIFLNALSQLLLSLSIWSSNNGPGVKLTELQQKAELGHVQRMLKDLDKAMDKAASTCKDRLKEALEDNIYSQCPAAHREAQQQAIPIAQSWSGHRDNGGLYYMTYKAICRRDGGPFRIYDWNKQLTEPLEKILVTGWEKCFQRCIPRETKALANDMKRILQKYHQSVIERARKRGVSVVGLDLVSQKLATWSQLFVNLAGELNNLVTEKQRDANRELTPVIAASMQQGYDLCLAESGTGAYNRMRTQMSLHVSSAVQTMYLEATKQVCSHLEAMFVEVCAELERQKKAIFTDMYTDYMNVLAGGQVPHGLMPEDQRTMRNEVVQEVRKTDDLFERLLLDEDVLKDEEGGYGEETKVEADQEIMEDAPEADEPDQVGVKDGASEHGTLSLEDAAAGAQDEDLPMPDIKNDDGEEEDYQEESEDEA